MGGVLAGRLGAPLRLTVALGTIPTQRGYVRPRPRREAGQGRESRRAGEQGSAEACWAGRGRRAEQRSPAGTRAGGLLRGDQNTTRDDQDNGREGGRARAGDGCVGCGCARRRGAQWQSRTGEARAGNRSRISRRAAPHAATHARPGLEASRRNLDGVTVRCSRAAGCARCRSSSVSRSRGTAAAAIAPVTPRPVSSPLSSPSRIWQRGAMPVAPSPPLGQSPRAVLPLLACVLLLLSPNAKQMLHVCI